MANLHRYVLCPLESILIYPLDHRFELLQGATLVEVFHLVHNHLLYRGFPEHFICKLSFHQVHKLRWICARRNLLPGEIEINATSWWLHLWQRLVNCLAKFLFSWFHQWCMECTTRFDHARLQSTC